MVSSAIDDAVKAYGIILSQGDISISRKGDIIISLLHLVRSRTQTQMKNRPLKADGFMHAWHVCPAQDTVVRIGC